MEQGSNISKVCKQVTDERNMEANKRLKCYYEMKINFKAFAIRILTALTSFISNLFVYFIDI